MIDTLNIDRFCVSKTELAFGTKMMSNSSDSAFHVTSYTLSAILT